MSKGNSGILSKFQTKLIYTTEGAFGSDSEGHEVLTEVVVRFRSKGVNASHEVILEGRMAADDEWTSLHVCKASESCLVHIASWDYIRFNCIKFDALSEAQLIASAFFSDGIFVVEAINVMKEEQNQRLIDICNKLDLLNKKIDNQLVQFSLITETETREL